MSKATLEFFRQQGARGGKIGAAKRNEKISPERRREIARNASRKRWDKQTLPHQQQEPD